MPALLLGVLALALLLGLLALALSLGVLALALLPGSRTLSLAVLALSLGMLALALSLGVLILALSLGVLAFAHSLGVLELALYTRSRSSCLRLRSRSAYLRWRSRSACSRSRSRSACTLPGKPEQQVGAVTDAAPTGESLRSMPQYVPAPAAVVPARSLLPPTPNVDGAVDFVHDDEPLRALLDEPVEWRARLDDGRIVLGAHVIAKAVQEPPYATRYSFVLL